MAPGSFKMPFFASKPPDIEDDSKKSYDSETTSHPPTHQEANTVDPTLTTTTTLNAPKPTASRTPSTRFKEPIQHGTTGPSTAKPNRTPSNVSRPAIPKSTASTASKVNAQPTTARPPLQRRRTTAKTRYIDMLLEIDNVPKLHNILASGFTWILLAGYIVFPATFNKLKTDERLDEKANNRLKSEALATARNIPFLYVAAVACGIGVLGSVWLWWKHRKNYVWVINRVFLPALLNSIAGVISTLINVYTAQEGQFSVTARATIIATSICSVVTIFLFLVYNSIMLKWVRMRHDRETRKFEKSENEREAANNASVGEGGAVEKGDGAV